MFCVAAGSRCARRFRKCALLRVRTRCFQRIGESPGRFQRAFTEIQVAARKIGANRSLRRSKVNAAPVQRAFSEELQPHFRKRGRRDIRPHLAKGFRPEASGLTAHFCYDQGWFKRIPLTSSARKPLKLTSFAFRSSLLPHPETRRRPLAELGVQQVPDIPIPFNPESPKSGKLTS